MKLIRQNERANRPSRGLANYRRPADLARAFSDFLDWSWDPFFSPTEQAWNAPIDVWETKDHVLVKADLPGLNKNEVEISVDNGVLTIKGERKEAPQPEGAQSYQAGRFSGNFEYSFSLPADVKADQAKATFNNGMLELTLPKAEEAKAKQIKIEAQ